VAASYAVTPRDTAQRAAPEISCAARCMHLQQQPAASLTRPAAAPSAVVRKHAAACSERRVAACLSHVLCSRLGDHPSARSCSFAPTRVRRAGRLSDAHDVNTAGARAIAARLARVYLAALPSCQGEQRRAGRSARCPSEVGVGASAAPTTGVLMPRPSRRARQQPANRAPAHTLSPLLAALCHRRCGSPPCLLGALA
jgi:hypothetical protein